MPALARTGRYNTFRTRHTETSYIGHLGERGHRTVAERVHECLVDV